MLLFETWQGQVPWQRAVVLDKPRDDGKENGNYYNIGVILGLYVDNGKESCNYDDFGEERFLKDSVDRMSFEREL